LRPFVVAVGIGLLSAEDLLEIAVVAMGRAVNFVATGALHLKVQVMMMHLLVDVVASVMLNVNELVLIAMPLVIEIVASVMLKVNEPVRIAIPLVIVIVAMRLVTVILRVPKNNLSW
jgi:hypothetical protein